MFRRNPDGSVNCTGIDFGNALATKVCQHVWIPYVGFTQSYDYCQICGEKRT
jgi:hypothetical protein